ncbi:MAG: tRNA (adenosine(37)-N6)-threonylcarbamoyltransferase complex dimerization subunit type 1 TsaB, partial [Actinomycetota bacterium]|nr:tRNA (adenosine(37)-N6)-threonylcarbamoyltransferase complex dimerization subunit type 1 TsaB [Actinomycetota bacterium]
MSVLAFDTATRATTVALVDAAGEALLARDDPDPGQRPAHTTRLMALIDELLAQGGGWSAVDTIAVGTGPGTFTGLRIGIATALALGQARDLPVTGVSSLASLALGADVAGDGFDVVLAVLDARRREVFAAGWAAGSLTAAAPRSGTGNPTAAIARLPAAALAPDALARTGESLGRCLAVGDGAQEYRAVLEAGGITVAAASSPHHRVDAAVHA